MPISPAMPSDVSWYNRQFKARSRSGLGEVLRQLFFLFHCPRDIASFPVAAVRMNFRTWWFCGFSRH